MKPALFGIIAALSLLGAYALLLGIANGPEHLIEQFAGEWYFLVPLAAGFGTQVGLFSFVRAAMTMPGAGATVASTGGMTAGSMAACCVHHVTDLVPVLGATVVGAFLLEFQPAFLLLGVLSNIVGIIVMLQVIQRHGLHRGRFPGLFRYDLLKVRDAAVAGSVVVLVAFLLFPIVALPARAGPLAPQTASENGLEITATPRLSAEGTLIDATFTTHQGSLAYDFSAAATLRDDAGRTYPLVRWDGPPPGGHHLAGTLVFPALTGSPQSLTLAFADLHGVATREFSWTVG
ncbi:MAG: hypothetical protein HY369_03995 [Candidatus Aenigmarchaeota archaeon]|nr:hypothetical protein [Candidatus Aenigmarchaeota archaeon]